MMNNALTKPKFDYSKLKGRIIEKFGTQSNFAKAIGKSRSHVSMILNNQKYWSYNDIFVVSQKLEIDLSEIGLYFFKPKVHNMETL